MGVPYPALYTSLLPSLVYTAVPAPLSSVSCMPAVRYSREEERPGLKTVREAWAGQPGPVFPH